MKGGDNSPISPESLPVGEEVFYYCCSDNCQTILFGGITMNACDLIKEVDSALKDLASMTEEARNSADVLMYLDFLSKFHNYSFYNTLSIFFHCPTATHVAGFAAWKKLGRYVKKGESGIPILAPCFKKKTRVEANGEEKEEKIISFFRVVYVFDVSQTEGEELPEAPITANCSDKGLLPILEEIVEKRGVSLSYKTLTGSHHGTSYGGQIDVDDRLESGGKVAVIIHELAHELLHQNGRRVSRKQAETEAEAVSYVVSAYFGLKTASANYLALWNVPKDQITDSFQHIHQVAVELIRDIQSSLNQA
jgi:hypothetical protein